jgi:hypothetical protein
MDVPDRFQTVYRRAMKGTSRKAAIKAFCAMCMGWSLSEVRHCTAPDCPLFPYRHVHSGDAGSTQTTSVARKVGAKRSGSKMCTP